MWFGRRSNLRKLACTDLSLTVDDDVIKSVTVVRDLGVLVDAELTTKHHISRVVSNCFFQLRRLRQIRRSVGEEVTKRLVTALILIRLNYCNAVVAGLPQSTLQPPQRVHNAAALLVSDTKPRDHISPVLAQLHWLPVNQCITYKLHLVNVKHCPDYLNNLVHLTTDSATRPDLRSATRLLYRKPALGSKFSERAFSCAGLAAWNNLPDHIQSITNTASFKRQLKTFLFSACSYYWTV